MNSTVGTAEVVVIGGGIIGCATSYYLARAGMDVLCLEGGDIIGNGQSCRNGGGVRQSGRDPRELPLVMYGIQHFWPTLSEELGADCEYHQDGNLRLGKTDEHRKILEGLTDAAVKVGLDVRMIDGDEVREINPYLSDEVTCASWCPTDGHANPLATTLGYYQAAKRLGVHFISGERVTRLRKLRGTIRLVECESGDVFEGQTIVLSAGFGSCAIAKTVGIRLPLNLRLGEALVTEAEPHMFDTMLGTAEADFYGHQTKHGSFVFGGAPADANEIFETSDYWTRPFNESLCAPSTCRGILGYFPSLENAKVVRTWAGWIDETIDGVPIMGYVDDVPGLVLACGFTGHGFGIAPGAASQIAQLITTGATDVDLTELNYDRFRVETPVEA